ncbi:unnamed protein product [Pleuronectes platessa]|uniref:Uncharacterized protein n=1 Tax=Pleuronectes platessa TaxID=8262 RepID=A0A9N7VSE0_PLEPL|nr:unnamed protein product [Pleuronectes platessa]
MNIHTRHVLTDPYTRHEDRELALWHLTCSSWDLITLGASKRKRSFSLHMYKWELRVNEARPRALSHPATAADPSPDYCNETHGAEDLADARSRAFVRLLLCCSHREGRKGQTFPEAHGLS